MTTIPSGPLFHRLRPRRIFLAATAGLLLLLADPSLRADDSPKATASDSRESVPTVAAPIPDRNIELHGTVFGRDRQPAAGAHLWLTLDEWADPVDVGVSAADGSYRLSLPEKQLRRTVTPGFRYAHCQASLAAAADGFGPAWELLPSVGGGRIGEMKAEYEFDFHLVPDRPIAGQVVGVDGRPVTGALISVRFLADISDPRWFKLPQSIAANDPDLMTRMETDTNNWATPLYPTAWKMIPAPVTDSEGRFRIDGAGDDRVVGLEISGPGVRQARVSVLTRADVDAYTRAVREKYPRTPEPDGVFYPPRQVAGGDGGVRIYGPEAIIDVDPARTISGVVRDAATRQPLAGIRLQTAGNYGSAMTDRQGRYSLLRVEDDSTVEVIADPDTDTYLKVVQILEGAEPLGDRTLNFDLPQGTIVTGRVVEEETGRPIVSAPHCGCHDTVPCPIRTGWAYYYPLATNTALREAPTGRYFTGFPAGSTNYPLSVAIDPEGRFRIAVPPGPGVLLIQSAPGFPEFASASSHPESEGLHLRFPYHPLAGRLEHDGAPAGDPKTLEGFSGPIALERFHTYRVIDPPTGPGTLNVSFSIPRAPSRIVRFVDPDRTPVSGVNVQALGPSLPSMSVVTEDADIEILGLDADSPRILFATSVDGKYAVQARISVNDPPIVTVVMQPAAGLSARLLDDTTGQPLVGYHTRLSVRFAGNSEPPTLFLPSTVTDSEGRFEFQGVVPEGTTSVTIHQPPPREFWIGTTPTFSPESLQNMILGVGERRNVGDVQIRPQNLAD